MFAEGLFSSEQRPSVYGLRLGLNGLAVSEAKICADAIVRAFGEVPDQNIATRSACFSPITNRTSSWLSTNFIYGDLLDASGNVKGKGMHRVDIGEAAANIVDGDSCQDMFTWADSMFADSFIQPPVFLPKSGRPWGGGMGGHASHGQRFY